PEVPDVGPGRGDGPDQHRPVEEFVLTALVQLAGAEATERLVLAMLEPVEDLAIEDRVRFPHSSHEELRKVRETTGGDDPHVPRAPRHHSGNLPPEIKPPPCRRLRRDEALHPDRDDRRDRTRTEERGHGARED